MSTRTRAAGQETRLLRNRWTAATGASGASRRSLSRNRSWKNERWRIVTGETLKVYCQHIAKVKGKGRSLLLFSIKVVTYLVLNNPYHCFNDKENNG